MMLSQLAGLLRPAREARSRRGLVINLLVGLALIGGVAAHVTLIDYYHTLNIQIYTWRPLESYYRQGFLPAFISGAQTIKPPASRRLQRRRRQGTAGRVRRDPTTRPPARPRTAPLPPLSLTRRSPRSSP